MLTRDGGARRAEPAPGVPSYPRTTPFSVSSVTLLYNWFDGFVYVFFILSINIFMNLY